MITSSLDKQYCYYLANEDTLLGQYKGLYLVIAEDLSVHPFKSKLDAYYYGEENYGLGHFLLQYCDYDAVHTVNTVNMRMCV